MILTFLPNSNTDPIAILLTSSGSMRNFSYVSFTYSKITGGPLVKPSAFPSRDPEFPLRFILAGFYIGYCTGNQNLPICTFATGLNGSGFLCRKTLLEINHELRRLHF